MRSHLSGVLSLGLGKGRDAVSFRGPMFALVPIEPVEFVDLILFYIFFERPF